MSLVRAFTTKLNKHDELWKNLHIGRTGSQRTDKAVQRRMISSPVELVSTTNMLSYDAPNIEGTQPISVRKVQPSVSDGSETGDDSDVSGLTIDTDVSGTDASSVEQSPVTPEAKDNHLSCYFKPAVNTKSSEFSPNASARLSLDAPAVPQRMPSHSKKAHERLHRQRSIQRIISPVRKVSTETTERSLSDGFDTPAESPFGNEIAQLDEIAEEYGLALIDAEMRADNVVIESLCLAVFSAKDYEAEIAGDVLRAFYNEEAPAWI